MNVFKFINPTHPLKMEQGKIINGIKSKMWIERYREGGEFTFVAPIESGVKDILTIGSFISHTDTSEIMVVENHEIQDDQGQASDVTITGRSFETILDNRIVGSNKTFPVSGTVVDYDLGTNYSWIQAHLLINQHINATYLLNDDNAFPYITPVQKVTDVGTYVARTVKRGSVYQRVLELLEIDNIGIKSMRPGPWLTGVPVGNSGIIIHNGVDRRTTVVVSHTSGELDNADYLWSNKKLKNAALITGKWVETVVFVPVTAKEYTRRMMYVDGNDIDKDYTTAPSGGTLTSVVSAMQRLGRDAIQKQNDVVLVKAEVSKETTRLVYRKDYDLGDLVTVKGDYNQAAVMRITEYVEIEDENGESGYPTISTPDIPEPGGGVQP